MKKGQYQASPADGSYLAKLLLEKGYEFFMI